MNFDLSDSDKNRVAAVAEVVSGSSYPATATADQ
jgi:hypothetical protein